MKVIICCLIVSGILITTMRFILRSKINAQVWGKHGGKFFLKKWFLIGVWRYIPLSLFIAHILLTTAWFALLGSSIWAYYAAAALWLKKFRTWSVALFLISMAFIEPARHFTQR